MLTSKPEIVTSVNDVPGCLEIGIKAANSRTEKIISLLEVIKVVLVCAATKISPKKGVRK